MADLPEDDIHDAFKNDLVDLIDRYANRFRDAERRLQRRDSIIPMRVTDDLLTFPTNLLTGDELEVVDRVRLSAVRYLERSDHEGDARGWVHIDLGTRDGRQAVSIGCNFERAPGNLIHYRDTNRWYWMRNYGDEERLVGNDRVLAHIASKLYEFDGSTEAMHELARGIIMGGG